MILDFKKILNFYKKEYCESEYSDDNFIVTFKNYNKDKKKHINSFGVFPDIKYPLLFNNLDQYYCEIIFNINNNQNKKLRFYNGFEYKIIDNNIYNGPIKNIGKLRISIENIDINTIIYYKNIDINIYDSEEKNILISKFNNNYKNIIDLNNINTNNNSLNLKINDICKEIKKFDIKSSNFYYKKNKYNYILNLNNIRILNNFNFAILIQNNKFGYNLINFYARIRSYHDIEKRLDKNISFLKKTSFFINSIDIPLYFFIGHFNNYLHFIRDTLFHINNFKFIQKQNPKLKLLMYKMKYHPFILDFLKELDIDIQDIYFFDPYNVEKTLFKNIYIDILIDNKVDKFYLDYIRSNIYDYIYNKNKNICLKKNKRIYISRRIRDNKNCNIGENNLKSRECLNEKDLVNLLKKYNFEEVWSEDYNISEKIKLFNQCEYIFYTHGAGTINNYFIKNSNIHIFNSSSYGTNNNASFNYYSSKFNNNKINIYNFQTNSNSKIIGNCPWEINLEKVKKLLNNLFHNN